MKSEKTYLELKTELDKVMEALQQDDADIDKSLANYEKGMELIIQLEKMLKDAEIKVSKLKAKFEN